VSAGSNVEAVRRMFESIRGGANPEPLREMLEPEVEFIVHGKDPHAGRYVGHAGVREFFERWSDAWEKWEFHPERIEAVDDERVAVDMHQRGRGKGSGAEVRNQPGQLWTFRHGRVVRWEIFPSFDDAVAAGREAS
jgi:ketosteroid isomerase-like protein